MWRLKGCPKCTGDMFAEQGYFGWYEYCLQCGYRHDINLTNKAKLADIDGKNASAGMRFITEVNK